MSRVKNNVGSHAVDGLSSLRKPLSSRLSVVVISEYSSEQFLFAGDIQ
jgi:hypothetical protein